MKDSTRFDVSAVRQLMYATTIIARSLLHRRTSAKCLAGPFAKVDVEIEEMSSKHAKGKPVNINRGGNRTRLRAVMPNGGVTLVTYDTRVTSEVCGRVVYVHSDNTEVMCSLRILPQKNNTKRASDA